VYIPHDNVLAVNDRGSGNLDLYAANSLAHISSITFGRGNGDLRYDAATGRLYLGYDAGHQSGIAIMDSSGRPLAQLPLDSHPAGFVVDASAKCLYVNLPESREIAVFDLAGDKRIATWSLGAESGANFPMALDAARNRLFVATRSPDRLLVLEARTGRIQQTLMAPGDVGNLFYNAGTQELYVSGGTGSIAVYASDKTGWLKDIQNIRTRRGARTSLLDPVTGHYYLAVPAGHGSVAEIRVYVVVAKAHGSAQ
ncbi:MAG: YncE family protein, partial [Gammaproteobacteria bacterium]